MPPPPPPRIEGPMEPSAAPPAPARRRRRRRPCVTLVVALNVAALLVLALLPGGAAVKRASASAGAAAEAATPKPPSPSPPAAAGGGGGGAVGGKSKAKHVGAAAAAASGGRGGGKKGSKGKGKGKAAAGGVCSSSSSSAEAAADALLLSSSSDGEGEDGAAAGSGITIHMLQEKDGKARRLTLPPAIATPSALRHHLLAQGLVSPLQADGLKLRRRKEGSRPATQGLSSASELRNGDVIIIAPSAAACSSAVTAGKKTDKASGAATGAFVPYPQYAYKKGKEAKARSFSEIELYKVTRQERAHASIVEVDPLAVGNFIGRVGESETRVALLFGSVDEQAPPTKAAAGPVRGRSVSSPSDEKEDGKKVVVRVAAVMEVDASLQQHGPGHRLDDRGLYHHHHRHSASASSSPTKPPTGNDARSSNPDVARAVQVAGLMGLKPVGWVVSRPGGDGDGGGFLNAQEVVVAARLQIEALKEAGHSVGDGFVTLAVNTTGTGGKGAQHSVEAFQVSQQAVQMLWDGLIDESNAGPTQAVPTTSDVFVSGDTRRTVDAAFLTLPVGITEASTTTAGAFKRAGPLIADDEALREALLAPIHPSDAPPPKKDKQRIYPAHVVPPPPSLLDSQPRWLDTRPRQLLSRLSDFHLVVYLARYLRAPELKKLCTALTAFGMGAPVAAKEGAAKGVSVPPAVRALLEALCDEG